MTAHYYPHLDFDNMTDDDFAFWSENAVWLHSQMQLIQQANALSVFAGGAKR